MFQNFRLWAKIMTIMGLAVVGIGVALTSANLASMNHLIDAAERSALNAHFKAIDNAIAAESRMAEALAALVASLTPVQDQFAAGERQALTALLQPGFRRLAKDYAIEQFQFHTSPALSFLRLHRPGSFGDDLSALRPTVVATNKNQQPTRGLEGGIAGLGARGVVPVLQQARPVGSVEFGIGFGQAFMDAFKARNGVEVGLHLRHQDGFKTLASTVGQQALLGTEALLRALQGTPQLEQRQLNGVPHAVYAAALNDFSGKPVGVIEIAMDSSAYQAMLADARNTAITLGLAAVGFGLLLALLLARHLGRRIDCMVVSVKRIAGGDLSGAVSLPGRDEIAELARATHDMRDQLHRLVTQVSGNAGQVRAAALVITEAVEAQAASTSQMSSSVAEITSTMEQLSVSSTQIAEHSTSVLTIASQAFEGSRAGAQAMQSVLGCMHDIQTDNQRSLQEIIALGEQSRQIGKVMEIINGVADQTKLIAFNAALEAAGAGAAGKRFSVVASEIRRLADGVTDATREIELRIHQIQDVIGRLVLSSEKSDLGSAAGSSASSAAAERLEQIVQTASATRSAAQQISLSTRQQQSASGQVLTALREIVSASAHTAQSIQHISTIGTDIAALSQRLSASVGQFKL